MARPFKFSIGEFYHVYNRGTEKREIFSTRNDYLRFVCLLFLANSTETVHISATYKKELTELLNLKRPDTLVDIGAYCLMPNHFHLILHEKIEGGISKFMQKMTTAYTMYFNKKNDRTGALFQGVFKAKHAGEDEYLKYLFAYVHLNPIKLIEPEWKENGVKNKKRALDFLNKYEFSSYADYVDIDKNRKENIIINKNPFPDYFQEKTDFGEFIDSWLQEFKAKP